MTSEPVVSLDDVTFTYEDGVVALRDLSLQVHAGEFAVVLGANGAGKSTLCYLISGIVPHIYGGRRRGEVLAGGKDPWDEPLYVTAQTCGMLMQDPEVQLFMPTVRAELAFGPSNLRVSRAEILSRVEAALELVQLSGFEDRNPRELSGGQKQRVALASILTMNPQILVLDEPTSQLDPLGRREVVAAIAELKRRGDLAIVMTTHETEEILPLADQVLVLENGLAAVQGTSRGVFSQPRRLEAAGVKVPALLQVQSQVAEVGGSDGDLRVEASVAQVAAEVRRAVSRGELTLQDPPSPVAAVQPTEGAPIVEVEDLTMTYPASPPVVALSKMNLTLHEGEFAAIIGQNGSGKSTLVKCLVGLLRPALGRVRFRGQDIRRLSVGEMARRVGLVLQNPDYQLFTSSCREEVRFGLKNLHLPAGEIEERCDQALAAVGLLEQADVFPFRLSFGDRRKLAVAATLALRPEVLILDEPTTAQDYRGRYQLAELARSFHDEQGGTVVIISHDVDLVARYAERVIVLQAGHVLLDGPSAQVFAQEERLKESFVVSPVLMQLAHELSDLGLPSGWTDPEEFAQMLRPAGREEGVR